MENIIPNSEALRFILASNAKFVLWNQVSGKRYTYHVVASSKTENLYAVYIAGEYSASIYRYDNGVIRYTSSALIPDNRVGSNGLQWFMSRLTSSIEIPETFVMYHLGLCCRCLKPLVDPESIAAGIGPICRKKILD